MARLPIEPGWDQLLYTASGVMTVEASTGAWVIPPDRALWLPGGMQATVRARGKVAVRTLYLDRSLGARTGHARAVTMTPLARELLLHTIAVCPLDLERDIDAALLAVLLDRLGVLPDAPLDLPAPRDPRASDTAARLWDQPSTPLGDVTAAVGASRRTLERLFVTETGLTLAEWRRRARILRSLELLATGASVTSCATAVGYSTPSSFVASFKATMGATPTSFLSR